MASSPCSSIGFSGRYTRALSLSISSRTPGKRVGGCFSIITIILVVLSTISDSSTGRVGCKPPFWGMTSLSLVCYVFDRCVFPGCLSFGYIIPFLSVTITGVSGEEPGQAPLCKTPSLTILLVSWGFDRRIETVPFVKWSIL